MGIRNLWSLNPGELLVAEKLVDEKVGDVFFPLHDTGVDLIMIKNLSKGRRKSISIQVKESKQHKSGRTWHQIHDEKFHRYIKKVDFYVFVCYLWKRIRGRMGFDTHYIVVPTTDLKVLVKNKKSGKNKVYSFSFNIDIKNKHVTEEREGKHDPPDYSKYLNNWDLIKRA